MDAGRVPSAEMSEVRGAPTYRRVEYLVGESDENVPVVRTNSYVVRPIEELEGNAS